MLLLSVKHLWPPVLPKLEGWGICSLSTKYDDLWCPLGIWPKTKLWDQIPSLYPAPPPHPPTPQLKIDIDRCIMQILESVVHINLWPRWTTFFRTYIYNSSPHTQPYLIILLYIKCKCYKEIPRGLIARCNAIHRTGLNSSSRDSWWTEIYFTV